MNFRRPRVVTILTRGKISSHAHPRSSRETLPGTFGLCFILNCLKAILRDALVWLLQLGVLRGCASSKFVPISVSVLVRSTSRACECECLVNVFFLICCFKFGPLIDCMCLLKQYIVQDALQRCKSGVHDNMRPPLSRCNRSREAPSFV